MDLRFIFFAKKEEKNMQKDNTDKMATMKISKLMITMGIPTLNEKLSAKSKGFLIH